MAIEIFRGFADPEEHQRNTRTDRPSALALSKPRYLTQNIISMK